MKLQSAVLMALVQRAGKIMRKIVYLIFAILWLVLGILFFFKSEINSNVLALLICSLASLMYTFKASENDGD